MKRVLGCEPLGAPPAWPTSPGGQSGAGRPHDACQPREKLSCRRSLDELYKEDLEPKIEEGHAELLPEHTETCLEISSFIAPSFSLSVNRRI